MINVELNATGYLGLPKQLRFESFTPVYDYISGEFVMIKFNYVSCVVGTNGEIFILEHHEAIYTNDNKKNITDENGNVIPIGVIEGWLQLVGNTFIIPDLQDTLNKIAVKNFGHDL